MILLSPAHRNRLALAAVVAGMVRQGIASTHDRISQSHSCMDSTWRGARGRWSASEEPLRYSLITASSDPSTVSFSVDLQSQGRAAVCALSLPTHREDASAVACGFETRHVSTLPEGLRRTCAAARLLNLHAHVCARRVSVGVCWPVSILQALMCMDASTSVHGCQHECAWMPARVFSASNVSLA